MTPVFVLLNMYKGTTFRMSIGLDGPDGEPFDLTGYSARMEIRTHVHGPLVMALSTAIGSIVLAEGEIRLHVPAPATTLIPLKSDYDQWVYDLELYRDVDGEEEVLRPIFGAVVFYPEVTRTEVLLP